MRPGGRFGRLSFEVLPVLIGINVLVWLMWFVAIKQLPDQTLNRFMNANFAIGARQIEAGHIWTLLTAAFSHQDFFPHFVFNMIMLFLLGRIMISRWGSKKFLKIYLFFAVFSCAMQPLLTWLGWPNSSALGASGAISGLLMCFALYWPQAKVYLFMILPIKAWQIVALGGGYDLYQLINEWRTGFNSDGIGHGVHLGGFLAAVIYVRGFERGRLDRFIPRWNRGSRTSRKGAPRGRILRPDEQTWTSSSASPRQQSGLSSAEERELDNLLGKVSRGGLDSLTPKELKALEEISQRKRKSGRP